MGIIKTDISTSINPDEFKIDTDGDEEKIYVEKESLLSALIQYYEKYK